MAASCNVSALLGSPLLAVAAAAVADGNSTSSDAAPYPSTVLDTFDDGPRAARTWDEVCVLLKADVWPINEDHKATVIDLHRGNNGAAHVFRNYTTVEYEYVLPVEESYFKLDPYYFFLWITNSWTVSIYASILYVFVVFGLQRWMRDRKPYDLRYPLFLWNLGLAVFSIIGTQRMMSELIFVLREHGFEHSVCVSSYAFCNKVTAIWVWWFANSKLVELGDTIFIVLRKQRLLFLHWYHHITVLVYTYYSMSTFTAQGRWFVACNLLVHSAMYSYYALRAARVRIPRNVAMAVTSSQLLQMVVGIYINWSAFAFKRAGTPCSVTYENLAASFLMYLSYFVLFGKFFVDAYIDTRSAIHKPKKVPAPDAVSAQQTQMSLEDAAAARKSRMLNEDGAAAAATNGVRQRRTQAAH